MSITEAISAAAAHKGYAMLSRREMRCKSVLSDTFLNGCDVLVSGKSGEV